MWLCYLLGLQLTHFMRQLVAEHGDGSSDTSREAGGEGRAYGHPIHEDVHPFSHENHGAEGVLAAWLG